MERPLFPAFLNKNGYPSPIAVHPVCWPDSVKFCHKLGLADVSCSPYRVPVARLAAAQAAIEEKRAAASKAVAPAKKAKKK